MGKKSLRARLELLSGPMAALLSSIAALAGLLLFRLGSLVNGYAPQEVRSLQTFSLGEVYTNPLYAPFKLTQLFFIRQLGDSPLHLRFASVIVGFFAVILFYYVVRSWFSWRVALLTSILFGTSPWFLHSSRFGYVYVTYLSILGLAALATYVRSRTIRRPVLILGIMCLLLSVYVPGMLWLIIIGIVWQYKTLAEIIRRYPLITVLGGLALAAALSPLILSFIRNPDLLYTYAGLPQDGIVRLVDVPMSMLRNLKMIVWSGPTDPAVWLIGRYPLLNFFAVIMSVIGLYSYYLDSKLDRTKFVVGGMLAGWILVSLGGEVHTTLLLPLCYLLVAGGIAFMLKQWFKVFPYNPFARSLAVVLLVTAVGAVCWHNMQHYFVAWPQAPATRKVYQPTSPVIQ